MEQTLPFFPAPEHYLRHSAKLLNLWHNFSHLVPAKASRKYPLLKVTFQIWKQIIEAVPLPFLFANLVLLLLFLLSRPEKFRVFEFSKNTLDGNLILIGSYPVKVLLHNREKFFVYL